MGKRKSESLSAAISKADFDKALIEYSANETTLEGLAAELQGEIQALKEEYSPDVELIQGSQKMLFATIKAYCVTNKAELMPTEKKSFENLYAKIGFRKGNPSVKFNTGVTEEMVIAKLKELGLVDYVRTVEEVNKELLIQDRATEKAAQFAELGLKVVQDEKFYVDLKQLELATA